jgi:hypothetical protein
VNGKEGRRLTALLKEVYSGAKEEFPVAMSSTSHLSWDTAIADAKHEIRKAKRRIARLTESIKAFDSYKKSGEPFPSSAPPLDTNSADNEDTVK